MDYYTRLLGAKKMMKSGLRPYDEMKSSHQDWLNEVPIHWNLVKSKRLFRETSIKNHPDEELLSATQNKGVVPRHMLDTRVVMPMGNFESFKLVKEGNFVISLRSFQGGLEYSKYRGIVSPAYNVLEETTGQNRMYYKYLFKSKTFISELQRNVTGIRQGKNIDVKDFKEIVLPVPEREEQDQIVKYLDYKLAKINKFIKAKKKLIAVLKEQKQAIINQAVTKGLDPDVKMKQSGIEWLGDVPEHWVTKKIKHFSKVNPNTRSVAKQLKDDDCLVFLPMEKISIDGEISCSEKRKYGDVKSGFTSFLRNDVVIAKITPCFENGKGACLNSLETEIGFGTTELIVLRANNEYVDEEYLYYITKTDYFRLFGAEVMTGSAGQKRVPTNYVANFRLAIPGLEEQHSIVESITSKFKVIDESINKIHQELELIQQFRVSLINSVVTGKVDLRSISNDFNNDSDDDNLDEFLEDNECDDTCGYIDEGGDE